MPRLLARKPNSSDGIHRTVWRNPRAPQQLVAFWGGLVCLTGFAISSASAQTGAGIHLESPILPETVAVGTSAMPGAPVGTAVSAAGMMPASQAGVAPEVTQANFVGCTGCGSIGCSGCDEFLPGYQCPPGVGLWIRADYLIWYEDNMDTIPLATTSSTDSTNADYLTLTGAETSVLFGDRGLNADPLEGWRLEIGSWLNPSATFGIFGRYYEVGDRVHSFRSDSNTVNALGIPFFSADANEEAAFRIVAANNLADEQNGTLAIDIDGGFQAWEVLFRRLAQTGGNYRLDWVYGYRNTRMYESLDINATTQFVAQVGLTPEDTIITLTDEFDVKNQFHGVDLGVTGHSQEGCWSVDFLLKVALGVMDQEVTIDGTSTNFAPTGDQAVLVGGLFSQETNIGRHDTSEFGIIPELNLNLGYAITPNLDFTIGYSFIYLNSVLRAGTAIDRVVDEGLLADLDPINSNRPQVNFEDTSYHIHGLNIGITSRF